MKKLKKREADKKCFIPLRAYLQRSSIFTAIFQMNLH